VTLVELLRLISVEQCSRGVACGWNSSSYFTETPIEVLRRDYVAGMGSLLRIAPRV